MKRTRRMLTVLLAAALLMQLLAVGAMAGGDEGPLFSVSWGTPTMDENGCTATATIYDRSTEKAASAALINQYKPYIQAGMFTYKNDGNGEYMDMNGKYYRVYFETSTATITITVPGNYCLSVEDNYGTTAAGHNSAKDNPLLCVFTEENFKNHGAGAAQSGEEIYAGYRAIVDEMLIANGLKADGGLLAALKSGEYYSMLMELADVTIACDDNMAQNGASLADYAQGVYAELYDYIINGDYSMPDDGEEMTAEDYYELIVADMERCVENLGFADASKLAAVMPQLPIIGWELSSDVIWADEGLRALGADSLSTHFATDSATSAVLSYILGKGWDEVDLKGCYSEFLTILSFQMKARGIAALSASALDAEPELAELLHSIAGYYENAYLLANDYDSFETYFKTYGGGVYSWLIPYLVGKFGALDQDYAPQFTDVPDGLWYSEVVNIAGECGLVKGKGDGSFAPDDTLSVIEAVILACRINCFVYGTEDPGNSAAGLWYQNYLDFAAEHGIPCVYSNYSAPISRSEYVHIFFSAVSADMFNENSSVADGAVPDVGMGDEYADEIYAFYRAGILTGGDSLGTFGPEDSITRASVATIVCRVVFEDMRQVNKLA